MEQEKSNSEVKKGRERSTAYPVTHLEEAVELVSRLREKLGRGPHKRSAAAVGIGYSGLSGASARKLSAITQFGLLERAGDRYTISSLAERIIFPKSDEDKQQAILEAAGTPVLYNNLLQRFTEDKLPAMLPNILYTDYGISPGVAAEAHRTFIETMKYAKLLDENGILQGFTTPYPIEETGFAVTAEHVQNSKANIVNKSNIRQNEYKRELQGTNWRIIIETEFALNKEIQVALLDLEEAIENISHTIKHADTKEKETE